jgi:hypothetical protein
MKRGALVLVLGGLLAATPAFGYDRPPVLERVASFFTLRPAEVRCPSLEEWTGDPIWGTAPNPQRAWGYTDMVDEHIVLHPALCTGALAVPDATVPAWQRATGVSCSSTRPTTSAVGSGIAAKRRSSAKRSATSRPEPSC